MEEGKKKTKWKEKLLCLFLVTPLLLVGACGGGDKGPAASTDAEILSGLLLAIAPDSEKVFRDIAYEYGSVDQSIIDAHAATLPTLTARIAQVSGVSGVFEEIGFWTFQTGSAVYTNSDPVTGTVTYDFFYEELPDHPLVRGQITYIYEWVPGEEGGGQWVSSDPAYTLDEPVDVSGAIVGTVINAITEEPVVGARVYSTLDNWTSLTVLTDENGDFEIWASPVAPTVTVVAEAFEFERGYAVTPVDAGPVPPVSPNVLPEPIRLLPIDPDGMTIVGGTIAFLDGSPVNGLWSKGIYEKAIVHVLGEDFTGDGVMDGVSAYTDENGDFLVYPVSEGDYVLLARIQDLSDISCVGQTYCGSWPDPVTVYIEFTVTLEDTLSSLPKDLGTIVLANTPPVLDSVEVEDPPDSTLGYQPGYPITVFAVATDPDWTRTDPPPHLDKLEYQWSVDDGFLSVSFNEMVEWTPATDGWHTISVCVNDRRGGEDCESLSIFVGGIFEWAGVGGSANRPELQPEGYIGGGGISYGYPFTSSILSFVVIDDDDGTPYVVWGASADSPWAPRKPILASKNDGTYDLTLSDDGWINLQYLNIHHYDLQGRKLVRDPYTDIYSWEVFGVDPYGRDSGEPGWILGDDPLNPINPAGGDRPGHLNVEAGDLAVDRERRLVYGAVSDKAVVNTGTYQVAVTGEIRVIKYEFETESMEYIGDGDADGNISHSPTTNSHYPNIDIAPDGAVAVAWQEGGHRFQFRDSEFNVKALVDVIMEDDVEYFGEEGEIKIMLYASPFTDPTGPPVWKEIGVYDQNGVLETGFSPVIAFDSKGDLWVAWSKDHNDVLVTTDCIIGIEKDPPVTVYHPTIWVKKGQRKIRINPDTKEKEVYYQWKEVAGSATGVGILTDLGPGMIVDGIGGPGVGLSIDVDPNDQPVVAFHWSPPVSDESWCPKVTGDPVPYFHIYAKYYDKDRVAWFMMGGTEDQNGVFRPGCVSCDSDRYGFLVVDPAGDYLGGDPEDSGIPNVTVTPNGMIYLSWSHSKANFWAEIVRIALEAVTGEPIDMFPSHIYIKRYSGGHWLEINGGEVEHSAAGIGICGLTCEWMPYTPTGEMAFCSAVSDHDIFVAEPYDIPYVTWTKNWGVEFGDPDPANPGHFLGRAYFPQVVLKRYAPSGYLVP